MPAYVQYREIEPSVMMCPSCWELPLHIRDIEPFWSAAKVDFIYECADCGAEVRKTLIKPERPH
jgi:hypothetical protein